MQHLRLYPRDTESICILISAADSYEHSGLRSSSLWAVFELGAVKARETYTTQGILTGSKKAFKEGMPVERITQSVLVKTATNSWSSRHSQEIFIFKNFIVV